MRILENMQRICKAFIQQSPDMLGNTGTVKKRAIQSTSEAAEKATRWLSMKRAHKWAAAGMQVGADRPGLGCLGKGVHVYGLNML